MKTLEKRYCSNQLMFQRSYEGTGVFTLPFHGTFIIERRAVTSSESQYTLLEI